MTTSGQVARRTPDAVAPAGSSAGGSARARPAPARQSGFDQHTARRLVRLALVGHMLRSRRFYERMAVGAIVLAALRGVGQENSASTMARLTAWNKREMERLERKVKQVADLSTEAGCTPHLAQGQPRRQGYRVAVAWVALRLMGIRVFIIDSPASRPGLPLWICQPNRTGWSRSRRARPVSWPMRPPMTYSAGPWRRSATGSA